MVDFWQQAGPGNWFAKDEHFDRTLRGRFLVLHEAAVRGEHRRADLSGELARKQGETDLTHARGHRDTVRQFGRFPPRNAILGRKTSAAEQRFGPPRTRRAGRDRCPSAEERLA